MQKLRIVLLLVPILFVAVTLASLAWASQQAEERLADGITIAGVDVGGLTHGEALRRVWSALRGPAMRGITVRVADQKHELTARRARVRLRLPAAVDAAQAASQDGTFLERGWRELTGGEVRHNIAVNPAASRQAIRAFVEDIERSVARSPVDARLSIAVDGVTVSPSRPGKRLVDAKQLADRVERGLARPTGPRSFEARVERVRPDVKRADVWNETPTVVTVSRSGRRARLFLRGRLISSYRVAVGQPGYPTPLGRFTVQTMQRDPVWNVPESEWAGELAGQTIPAGDPRNPLIARWIGFDGAVGFHGTESLESLGRAASRGCVRMRPQDIIQMFSRVQVGTPVLVAR